MKIYKFLALGLILAISISAFAQKNSGQKAALICSNSEYSGSYTLEFFDKSALSSRADKLVINFEAAPGTDGDGDFFVKAPINAFYDSSSSTPSSSSYLYSGYHFALQPKLQRVELTNYKRLVFYLPC